jgi:hypothetical protein
MTEARTYVYFSADKEAVREGAAGRLTSNPPSGR